MREHCCSAGMLFLDPPGVALAGADGAANRIALDPAKSRSHDACMNTTNPRWPLLPMRRLPAILLLTFAGCGVTGRASPPERPGSAAAAPAPAPSGGEVPALLAQMRAMVGTAACTDTAQCKTVAVGARSCGGPEAYLAYSAAATPEEPLRALAARYAEQRRAEHAKSGEMSTCQFVPDPGAVCQAGACLLRTAPAGAT
jgi:hypothetical protein